MEDGEIEDVPMIVSVRGQALLKDIVECCYKMTTECENIIDREWMDEWMDGQRDEWMDRQMNGLMNGWID